MLYGGPVFLSNGAAAAAERLSQCYWSIAAEYASVIKGHGLSMSWGITYTRLTSVLNVSCTLLYCTIASS